MYEILRSVEGGAHYLLLRFDHPALWAGVVVVFLEITPKAKRRQLRQALDDYQPWQREKSRAGSDRTPNGDGAPTAS